jgi:hypothetical protein
MNHIKKIIYLGKYSKELYICFLKMQLHQVTDDDSNIAEPAVAEDKVAEQGTADENAESPVKIEEFLAVK